jgi:hypothetical protein
LISPHGLEICALLFEIVDLLRIVADFHRPSRHLRLPTFATLPMSDLALAIFYRSANLFRLLAMAAWSS